jgi:thiol-disulfide isomerase/thioredoxin
MDERAHKPATVFSRRSILLAAPALLPSLHARRALAGDPSWPPVFETGRSQFTVVRPRAAMPRLQLGDLRGRDAVVTARTGRIMLVNFWATWCAACRLDLPALAQLAATRPERLDIVAICTDTTDLRQIGTFLGRLPVQNLNCLVDVHGIAAGSDSVFSLVAMPVTYLVGPTAQIEGYITGAPDWLSPAAARLFDFYRDQA